jgi:hypothetical protein
VVTVVVGIVVMAVIFTKRPVNVEQLGYVSYHWIAQHR